MKHRIIWLLILLTIIGGGGHVLALKSTSSHYSVNEVQFGSGSLNNASSSHYSAQENLGSTAVGNLKSTSYYAEAGFLTPNAPFLAMIVTPSTLNLGTMTATSTVTGTAAFSIRAYVDSGYVVESMNTTPVNESGKYLANLSSASASSAGTEQFGMNLKQNLTTCTNPAPANFGQNPVPIPNSNYATGVAAAGYNTCGLFKYNQGDVIAQSNLNGWGETDYTISYIANISPITSAGVYKMTQDLVVIATY
jgi:hypothetical protein